MEVICKKEPEEVLLDWKSTSGKRGHFREDVLWIPARHRVIRRTTGAVRRFFGLVVKPIEPREEILDLPEALVTEAQVLEYVRQYKRHWIGRR